MHIKISECISSTCLEITFPANTLTLSSFREKLLPEIMKLKGVKDVRYKQDGVVIIDVESINDRLTVYQKLLAPLELVFNFPVSLEYKDIKLVDYL